MASLERIKQLNEYDQENNFVGTGVSAAGSEITEAQLFESVFRSASTIHLSERTVQLPGMARAKPLIRGAVKRFAREVIESNFRQPAEASVDEVTVQPIRPETFGNDNFQGNAGSTGTVQIVDDGAGNEHSLNDDEWVIVTDLVEYDSQANLTAIQHTVDGDQKEAEEMRAQIRASDLQIYPLAQPEFAKETYQLEAKAENTGDFELVPHGVHIAKGDLVGSLT